MTTLKKIYPVLIMLALVFVVVKGSLEEANAAEGVSTVSWYTEAALLHSNSSDIGYLALSNLAANIIADNASSISSSIQLSSYMVYDGSRYNFFTECKSVDLVRKKLDGSNAVWVIRAWGTWYSDSTGSSNPRTGYVYLGARPGASDGAGASGGGYIYCAVPSNDLLTGIDEHLSVIGSQLATFKSNVQNYLVKNYGKLSTISDTLTDKLTSMESSLTRLLSRTLKTDQDGTQYTLAELVYNLWQKTDRIYDRTLKTVDSASYTISDLQYNTWQQTKSAVTKLGSIDSRLSTLHTDATSLGNKLDNIADLLDTTTFTCGYKSDATGTAYPTQTIPYDMAVQIAARINSEMLGKQMTVIKQDGSGTTTATISRCLVDSSGYIIVRSASAVYYLCGKDNTIFVAAQDYVKSIYSRMTDVISAVNNLTVGVDLSDVQLSVDASSINLFNNTAYCCGYQTDADGNLYPTLPIPYDSAAAIVERLNTDYVNKKITTISRSGSTSSGYLRHSSITSNGYISLVLANGYTYSLCDDANVLYIVDSSTNYGSRANDSLLNVSSKLDAILDQMQSTGGEYTCQHTYSQEMEQEPTCILPGLLVSTCSKCGNSYSEIVGALDHDWILSEHVDAVTDPDTEEVTQSAYDIYTCSRCGQTYEDHTGDGAPTDYGETSIAKIIIKLFAKLGTFAGKIISWVVDLFTKTLGGINDLFARFTELTAQITGFGGDYPTWLSGFWGVLSSDLQLALSFAFLCTFVGIIGKKLFFT